MKQYFYSDGESQFGPFTLEELKDQNIKPDSLVWYPGLESWIQINESEKLRPLLFVGQKPIIDLPDEEVPEVYTLPGNSNEGADNQFDDTENGILESPPKNWLLESILVTIICCNPIAVVGIIYAAQVDTFFFKGDTEKSVRFSQNAGLWVKIALGVSLFTVFFYIFVMILGLFAS